MLRNPSSISPPRRPFLAAAIAFVALVALSGCGRLMPFGATALDLTTTGSLNAARALGGTVHAARAVAPQESVDPSDFEAVRLAAAGVLLGADPGLALDWSNPRTGSTGTIMPLAATQTRADGDCRSFTTTLSDLRGVRRYRAEACARPGGRFEIAQVTADDGELL